MKPQEIMEKLEKGMPLSREESAWLDAQLESEEQNRVASFVQGLPAPTPSLAWRASLEERILREIGKKRSFWRRFETNPLFASSLVAAAAAVLIAVVWMKSTSPEPALNAEKIMEWHEEAVASASLPGDGVNMEGFATTGQQGKRDDTDGLLYGGSLHSL